MAVPFFIPDQDKLRQQNWQQASSGTSLPPNNNSSLDNVFSRELIARALCDALKQYYLESLQARNGTARISFEFKPDDKLK